MKSDNEEHSANNEQMDSSRAPADLPRPDYRGAVARMQDKLLLVEWKGRYYVPGQTPPQLYFRWDVCEGLAVKFAHASVESKRGKRFDMAEVEILAQYLPRLIEKRWTSEAEARWGIRRTAEILGWPCPPAAKELSEEE